MFPQAVGAEGGGAHQAQALGAGVGHAVVGTVLAQQDEGRQFVAQGFVVDDVLQSGGVQGQGGGGAG